MSREGGGGEVDLDGLASMPARRMDMASPSFSTFLVYVQAMNLKLT